MTRALGTRDSVAATQLKVDLKPEVGHVLVESHSNFLMGTAGWFWVTTRCLVITKSTQTMSATTPATPPNTTLPLPQSTLIKVNNSTVLPFTTHDKYCIETCTTMAADMKKYLIGPMPIEQFLDSFFPISQLPSLDNLPRFIPGHYHDVIKAKLECDAYDPFVSLNYSNELFVAFLTTVFLEGVIKWSICSPPCLCQFIQFCGL